MATTSCLICYDPVSYPLEDVDEEDLTVFTLQCLLQVEKYWLDKHQQEDKASAGIRLCDACQKGVEQAQALYSDLLEMGKKFRDKQKEAVDKIRTSGVSSSHTRRRNRQNVNGNMIEEVRLCVLEMDLEGPLLIQDWRCAIAVSPTGEVAVAVKQEVEEFPDPNESDGSEVTFPHVSEEAAEVKSEPESEDDSEGDEREEYSEEEEEAMDESLGSEEGDDDNGGEEEERSGEEEMDTDSVPPTKAPSRKGIRPPTQKKRMRYRKRFLHSLDDPEKDEKMRMFGRIRCPFCDLQGPNNTRIIALHVRNAHLSDHNKYRTKAGKWRFSCCGKRFPNWALLWEHLSEKHEAKPLYLCELCPEEFGTAFALQTHAFKGHHHKEQSQRMPKSIKIGITCQICGDLVKGKRALHHHMKQHDKASEALDESLRCTHCGLLKKWTVGGLHLHMSKQHGVKFKRKTYQKNLPCSEPNCDKIYTCKENLEAHVARDHKKQFLFHCDICGAGFYKSQRLKNHKQSRHSNIQIICEVCGKSFKSDERLYNHRHVAHSNGQKEMQKNPGDPKPAPEICDLCGKSFATRTSLLAHKAVIHNVDVKYRCHVCAQPFANRIFLETHLYSKHKIGERPKEMKSQMERLKFQCQLYRCKKRFSKQEYLDKHVKEVHGDSGTGMRFNCRFCGKGFMDKFKVTQHEMIHTNKETRPFKCDICGKGFVNQVNLTFHRSHTHKAETRIQKQKSEPDATAGQNENGN